MDNIRDLVQAAQQSHQEFMGWHDEEHRLMTCISAPHLDAIKQDIQQSRDLRRSMIAKGLTGDKEYKKLSAHLSSLEGELEDMKVVAQELEEGAFDRSLKGRELWQAHRARRADLARTYIDGVIAADLEEIRAALVPLLPLLARWVARGREQVAMNDRRHSYLVDRTDKVHFYDGLTEALIPEPPKPLDMVNELIADLLNPLWPEASPELEPEVMAEAKRIPSTALIRLDLVDTPTAIHRGRVQRELAKQPAASPKSAVQPERDNWSPEAMLRRAQNVRSV